MKHKLHFATIGLVNVGLHVALEFAKKIPVLGFDGRIKEFTTGCDCHIDANSEELMLRTGKQVKEVYVISFLKKLQKKMMHFFLQLLIISLLS